MARSSTTFRKGEIHNPKGRPIGAKNVLTKDLEAVFSLRSDDLANRLVDAIFKGKVQLDDGSYMAINQKTWLSLVIYVYNRIDGTPKQSIDVNDISGVARPIIMLPPEDEDDNGE